VKNVFRLKAELKRSYKSDDTISSVEAKSKKKNRTKRIEICNESSAREAMYISKKFQNKNKRIETRYCLCF